MSQAAAEQAFGRFLPIQLAELTKALGLLRVIEKGAFAQFQFPWLTVQQVDRREGELLLAYIQMGQMDFTVDHPFRLMAGREDAQLVRCAFAVRAFAAKGAGAAGQVAGQRVMTGGFVVAGIMAGAPRGSRQPVAQLGATVQAGGGGGG